MSFSFLSEKRVTALFIAAVLAVFMVSCGAAEQETDTGTIAGSLVASFEKNHSSGSSAEDIARKVLEGTDKVEFAVDVVPVTPGYLNGFTEEITGFKNGAGILPLIGSIPFVAYVFETEDAQSFAKLLDEKSVLNWNICTMADEKRIITNGDLVFFVMAPFGMEE